MTLKPKALKLIKGFRPINTRLSKTNRSSKGLDPIQNTELNPKPHKAISISISISISTLF